MRGPPRLRRKTWGGSWGLSWIALKAWVLYCSGAWSLACAKALARVLWVSTSPGGLEWLLDECSSDGLPVFAAFVAFTALMLAVQLHKMRLVLFAASIQPISSAMCLQALFSLVFVGKCAWSRASDRALNESVAHSILAHGRDLLIFSEAALMTGLLAHHYVQSPWRGRGRRMEDAATHRRSIRPPARALAGAGGAETVAARANGGRGDAGGQGPASEGASVSEGEAEAEAEGGGRGGKKEDLLGAERSEDERAQARAREREREDAMLANLQGRGSSTPTVGVETLENLAKLSPAERAAVHLSAVAPFSPGQ